MNKPTQMAIFLLRFALGWLFLYSGLVKLFDSQWKAAGYLAGAKTFPQLFHWLAMPQNITRVNFLNKWGSTLIGASLIFGLGVRWALGAGVLLMILYYLPVLKSPYLGKNYALIDDHVIYLLIFMLFIITDAGKFWGLDRIIGSRDKNEG